MKSLIIIITFLLTSITGVSLFSGHALAFDPFNPGGDNQLCQTGQSQQSSVCKSSGNSDPISGANGQGILLRAANLLSIIIGIAAVIVIIIGGLQYVLSSGDSARVNSAKNTILFAVIGLIVAILAQSIIRFVIGKL